MKEPGVEILPGSAGLADWRSKIMNSQSLGRLAGKRVLVTGASSGIGKALALAFAKEGAAVAIGANQRASQAQQVANSIAAGGGKAIVVVGDLVSKKDTNRIVDEAVTGLSGLDTFVHCAGVDVTQTALVHETSDEIWDQMVTIHMTSAFRIARRAIPTLLKNQASSVLLVGSVAGLVGWAGDVAYNVAKAGLHHLAKCIAADYAKTGLRANAIAPGVIDTPLTRAYASGMEGGLEAGMLELAKMHPIGRYATVEEVTGAAVYLVSDESRFVTGVILPIDGGLTMV